MEQKKAHWNHRDVESSDARIGPVGLSAHAADSNASRRAVASGDVHDRRILKDVMYSARDVERILSASERTVRDLPLRWVRFGRGRMVLGEDLLHFVRSQR